MVSLLTDFLPIRYLIKLLDVSELYWFDLTSALKQKLFHEQKGHQRKL
jgi:hypothetical protein